MAVAVAYTASSGAYSFSSPNVTFSGLSIGAAGSGRRIFFVYGYRGFNGLDRPATSATVGGQAATRHRQQVHTSGAGYNYYSEIWSAPAPDDVSTTASIVVTHSGLTSETYTLGFTIGVYRVTGHDSSSPVSSSNGAGVDAASVSASITVLSGGAFIAGVYTVDTGASPSFSWSGAAENFDLTVSLTVLVKIGLSGASGSSSATPQATYSASSSNNKSLSVVAIRSAETLVGGAGAASGSGTASATAGTLFGGVGVSAGIGGASAAGAKNAGGAGAAVGSGTGAATGASSAEAAGSASGIGAAEGVVAIGAAAGLLVSDVSIASLVRGNVLLECAMDAEAASEMIGTTAFVAAMESGELEIAFAADIELRSL